jgi:anti-sigma B factor antagonist
MSTPIAFDVSSDNGTTRVRVGDSIFTDNREPLLTALLGLADTPRARIVIDLSDVPLCDSAALNMFVQVHQRAADAGGSLRLTNPRPMVRTILRATNLDRLIPINADTDDDVER